MARPTSALVIALTLFATAAGGPAAAADVRPSWECLPAETAAMVRLPDPAGFLESLRTRTKFGAVALTDERMQAGWRLFLDAVEEGGSAENLEELEKSLGKYGLAQGDLQALLGGDVGVGLVVQPRQDGLPPVRVLLAWAEPGEEAATKLVAAARQQIEELITEDDDDTKRTDLEMAGHDVTWVTTRTTLPAMRLTAVQVGPARIQAQPANPGEAKPQPALGHTFFTRNGGRLLIGQSLPVNTGKPVEEDELDRVSGTDEVKGVFETFLARHAGNEESAVAEMMRLPGIAATLPEGMPLVEVAVDPRGLVKGAGDAGNAVSEVLKLVGAEHLGPFVWRQAFADGRWQSGAFLSLPAPRESLMRILDQECDPSEVPSFVSTDVAGVTQISLDLGKVYDTVREFAMTVRGPDAANMFAAAEAQAQAVLGTDVATALGSLGSRHWIVTYPPKLAEAMAQARKAKQEGTGENPQPANRLAVVWHVENEEPFARLLKQLAPMTGGELQEEQGFRGIRVPNGPAVFLGRDHLVVAIGSEALEKTLAAIRTPPTGEASLRESDVVKRAAELMPLEPARMFSMEDATHSGGTLGALRDMAAAMLPEDVEEKSRGLLARLQALLPSAAEVEGMFGAGVTLLRVEEAGLSLRSVWEMSAP